MCRARGSTACSKSTGSNDPGQTLGRAAGVIPRRFLLVVFGAAVVPLVLIGVWLTQSVVRAGEELLRSELDESLQRVAIGIESRWSYRRGDLALLTNNEVAQRLLASAAPQTLTAEESGYFDQLVADLAPTIPSFEYRDGAGDARWSSPAPQATGMERSSPAGLGDVTNARLQGLAPSVSSPTLTVRLSVAGSLGRPQLGELIARVDLAALLAIDLRCGSPAAPGYRSCNAALDRRCSRRLRMRPTGSLSIGRSTIRISR